MSFLLRWLIIEGCLQGWNTGKTFAKKVDVPTWHLQWQPGQLDQQLGTITPFFLDGSLIQEHKWLH